MGKNITLGNESGNIESGVATVIRLEANKEIEVLTNHIKELHALFSTIEASDSIAERGNHGAVIGIESGGNACFAVVGNNNYYSGVTPPPEQPQASNRNEFQYSWTGLLNNATSTP